MNLAMNRGTQLAPVTASVFHTNPNVSRKEESIQCVRVRGVSIHINWGLLHIVTRLRELILRLQSSMKIKRHPKHSHTTCS